MGFWNFLWNRNRQPVKAKYNSFYDESHRTVEVFAVLKIHAGIDQVWSLLMTLSLEQMASDVSPKSLTAGQTIISLDKKTAYTVKKYQNDSDYKIYQLCYQQDHNYLTTTFKWRRSHRQLPVKIQYIHRLIFEQTVGGLGGNLAKFQFKMQFKEKARQLEAYLKQKLVV